jgi:diadenosine tetraphosphatase ApaH/serine/threonine PP2A family protein phosphatase
VRRWFNSVARIAVEAHAEWLDPADVAYLAELPQALNVTAGSDLLLTHGTPGEETSFTYLTDSAQAARSFRAFRERFAAVGHTHVPALWEEEPRGRGRVRARAFRAEPADPDVEGVLDVTFEPGTRAIVNPGSVGQPRDGDPRAAFLVLDLAARAAKLHRIPYDVAGAQAAIRRRRLPEVLAARLAAGR